MNFTAFGRGTQPNPSLKRRFDPIPPIAPNGTSGNGNGNGNGDGNGHSNGASKDNGVANGHATNGVDQLNGNGNGHVSVNGNGDGHEHVNGNENGNGNGHVITKTTGNRQGHRVPSFRTTLSSDVEIKGIVKIRGEAEFDGKIEGTIESHGLLTVGKNGRVQGDIQTRSVTVHGTVDGNISVGDKCELRSGCTIRGDIETSRLIMDENVNFTGNAAISTRDYLAELRPLKRSCTCHGSGDGHVNGHDNGQNHS